MAGLRRTLPAEVAPAPSTAQPSTAEPKTPPGQNPGSGARGGTILSLLYYFLFENTTKIGGDCDGTNGCAEVVSSSAEQPEGTEQPQATGTTVAPAVPEPTSTPDRRVTFFHYTTASPGNYVNGLLSGSSATTRGDLYSNEASQGLGIPPPTLVYPVTIDPSKTRVVDGGLVDSSRRYAGGLPQVYFPNGTPPGSVGPPRPVPR